MISKRKIEFKEKKNASNKKFRARAQRKIDFDKSTKNKVAFYIERHVKNFMIRNSSKIYIVENRIENSVFRMTNYLTQSNIAYLRLMMNDLKNILEKYVIIRNEIANFFSYKNVDFFDWLNEIETFDDLNLKQNLSFTNCKRLKFCAMIILCTMYRFLKSEKSISQNSSAKNEAQYYEFSSKNWYRFFCFFKFYWKKRLRKDQKSDETSKKQNQIAEHFQYFDEIQLRTFKTNSRVSMKKFEIIDNDSDSRYEFDKQHEKKLIQLIVKKRWIDDLFDVQLKHWIFEHFLQFINELNDSVERERARAKYDLRILKNFRSTLILKKLLRIVNRLKDKYRLIYLELIDEIIIIISSIENLKTMTTQSLKKTNVLFMNKFVQKKQNDFNDRRIEISMKKKKRFFQIQENMNTYIAYVNDYDVVCQRFMLNSFKSLMFDQHVEQTSFSTKLKSHQVVALDWILNTKKLIESTLLIDDMKLRKTIIAFSMIAKYVYFHDVNKSDQLSKQSMLFINDNLSFIDNIFDHVDISDAENEKINDENEETDDQNWHDELIECQKLVNRFAQRKYKFNLMIASFQILFV